MSVRFIVGRSGSGKTNLCIREIVSSLLDESNNKPLLFLVPEQATYQAERAILSNEQVPGYSSGARVNNSSLSGNLNVLSFSRLQYLLLGKRTAMPELSRIGRQMIIQRILKDNRKKLKVLDQSVDFPGVAHQLAETITELHQYDKTPDDIDKLVQQLRKKNPDNLHAMKFADIALVLNEYLDFIEDDFLDPDVQLRNTCQAVAKAGFIKGAKLWVDGFSGFTTSQLSILAELLKRSSDAKIALCLDPSAIDLKNPDTQIPTEHLFYPTEQTYANLLEIIKKCRLRLDKPLILDGNARFSGCRQLAHVETNIFTDQPQKIPSTANVRIISAANARAEVHFAARQILELVRKKGYRYRDIAVIVADIEHYQHYIKAHFEDYGIGFFIDRRKFLNQHPIATLICSALDVITNGFSHNDIFSFLKNDLVSEQRSNIDLLENYCIAYGCSSYNWQSDSEWNFAGRQDTEFDRKQINQVRKKLIDPLLKLKNELCPTENPQKKISARDFVRTIFELLETLDTRRKLSQWIQQADDPAEADEHRQFYVNTVDIFDELVEVFGEQQMTSQDYIAIIKSAFSQLTLAFIPPKLDEVLVGSIERSRHPDLKAVFLLGATQNRFPIPLTSNGLLTDRDRIEAQTADFTLAANTSQALSERQYLAYIAFTRPSEFLYITYPLLDSKGSSVVRSQFVDSLQSLFKDLNEQSPAERPIAPDEIFCEDELSYVLCSGLGKDSPDNSIDENLRKLLNDVINNKQLKDTGKFVCSAIEYENKATLQKDITTLLFGKKIKASATRLSAFAACPYQYFAKYILELKERKEFKLEPLDVGKFYHCVLDRLVKQLNKEGKSLATIKDTELPEILKRQISEILQEDLFLNKFQQHNARNAYIIRSAAQRLEEFVPEMVAMVRAGRFKPAMSEVGFGKLKDTPDILGEYKIALSNGRNLYIRGKIDRLDIADINGEKVVVLFDYKRKPRSFNWPEFYNGIDMQLPIYMLAVKNSPKTKFDVTDIAGAFYLPVEPPVTQTTFEKLPTQTEKFDYKANGIFNGQFADQLDTTPAQGWNKFYNFHISKKDTQYGNYGSSGALKPDDFEKILQFTEDKIIQLAKEIISGKIDVTPYRLGTASPCSNCPYKPLCRFDWQTNDYTPLQSIGKKQAIEKMLNTDSKKVTK